MNLYAIARKKGTGAIIWTEVQKQYISTEYVEKDRTLKELAQEFGVQPQAIRNLLRKMNIKITNKKIRNYPRNSNYFTKIDSSDKAYWLGLLYADGTVGSSRNSIGLSLKDGEHIEKFKKAIGAINHKTSVVMDDRFSKKCIMYSFSIHDNQLHQDLIKWGCIPNKTYAKELHIPNIPEEFKWDFIRGYFDGDGCISWSNTNNRYYIEWAGNKFLMQDIRKECHKENVSLQEGNANKVFYILRLAGKKDVRFILQEMYKNANSNTVLNRKFKKVNSCLESLGASPLNL